MGDAGTTRTLYIARCSLLAGVSGRSQCCLVSSLPSPLTVRMMSVDLKKTPLSVLHSRILCPYMVITPVCLVSAPYTGPTPPLGAPLADVRLAFSELIARGVGMEWEPIDDDNEIRGKDDAKTAL